MLIAHTVGMMLLGHAPFIYFSVVPSNSIDYLKQTPAVLTLDILYRSQSYISICDLLIVFSSQLASNAHLKSLVYTPDRTMQGMLNDFIQTYVFVDDDDGKRMERLFMMVDVPSQ